MQLKFNNNIFYCESTFQEKDIPKSAGFRWNPETKKWWTNDPIKANKIFIYADESAKIELNKISYKIDESKAASANIEIPHNENLDYLPFQKAGIKYGKDKNGILIADEMGLGKTIQAIGLINIDETIKRILIVCPNSLKINWKRECEKWLVKKFSITVIDTKIKTFPESDIIIINYNILKKFPQIKEINWDCLILDESHYIKNYKAQRTREIIGYKDKENKKPEIKGIAAKKKILLTGTPILNKPIELFSSLHYIDPINWGSWWGFANRYCDLQQTKYGIDVSGSNNLDELQDKLRSTVMVRRLKKDVLTELPEKTRQVIEIPANGCSTIIDKEKSSWESYKRELQSLKIKVELAKTGTDEEYNEAIKNLKESASVAFTEMAKIRHETAVAKIPFVIEHLTELLENGQKIVVFAHHHDVINALYENFKNISVKLTGENTVEERQEAIDKFQIRENIKLFIGSIKAAGVGITLTESSLVVFAELDWVPGNITQAEDRVHRIGQKNAVLIQHLVLEESIDANIAKTLVEKQNIIDKALDIIERNIPILPKLEGASSNTSKKKIIDISEKLTNNDILKIHESLKLLAQICDGAIELDGNGFNKIDAGIGHALAINETLTKKQAALGYSIVKKYYKNQIPANLHIKLE